MSLLVLLGLLAAAGDDTEAVRRSFGAYKSALLAGDGAAAAAAVSANSLVYYEDLKALALSGRKEQIQARDGTEQMLILSLRALAPRALLRSGSGAQLIVYAVDAGMISRGAAASTDLERITIDGAEATGWLTLDGRLAKGTFRFHLEDGIWKFDLEHASVISRGVFRVLAERQGVSEEELLLDLLSRASGRPVGQEIWKPLE